MRYWLLIVLCLVWAFPAEAASSKKHAKRHAAPVKKEETTAASGMPVPRPVFDTDGSFGFCLAEYIYPDDRKLTVARSIADEVNLGLTIPNAGFTLGSRYDLSISLEPEKAKAAKIERSVRSTAIHQNALVLQMGANPAFIQALTTSKSLHVAAGGKKMEFSMPGIAFVYDALRKCIDANKNKKDSNAAMTEQALPETLKAVLVSAGLKDIVPMRMDNIPPEQRPADFIWQTGPLIGGVRERLVPKEKTLTDLAGLHIQGLKRKCSGTFNAEVGKEEDTAGLKLRTADVDCQMKGSKEGKDVFVAILFFVNAANRFTVFSHEGPAAAKIEAQNTRDAIRRTISQLAQHVEAKRKSEGKNAAEKPADTKNP